MQALKNIEVQTLENTAEAGKASSFQWDYLPKGYGITLGNSLRRILLSSIPGVAVTSLEIEGVIGGFGPINGVKEKVEELLLNIKALRLMVDKDDYLQDIVELNCSCDGELKIITAGAIQQEGITVLNPGLYLATLEKGNLNLKLHLSKGVGFVPAERNMESTQTAGVIPVDALFSPIIKVDYTVEEHIADNISYDLLKLTVFTDGSLDGKAAVITASEELIKYASLFLEQVK